jgi:phosphate/sulfate permease
MPLIPTTNGSFQLVCLIVAAVMLLWDTVEVGRNDAANLVNAVFGARVMPRRRAIILAGLAVLAGALMSSDVIDTARKKIFSPGELDTLEQALAIFVSVYIVDTVLLYGYSAFGMPVSTTACLVFELLGAAMAISITTVNWGTAGRVVAGIVCSIVFSGVAAFLLQRAVRGAIKDRTTQMATLLLHGGWVGGGLCAGLCYFLLLKGMKNLSWVQSLKSSLHEWGVGSAAVIFFLWGFFAIVIHILLVVFRKRAAKLLFPTLAVLGMLAMSFAFGQNDLANCASPGIAVWTFLSHQDLDVGSKVAIPWWMLFVCGLLLFAGMQTKNAERVTKAAVSTGSMGDRVELWAPEWCVRLAGRLLRFRGDAPALAPRMSLTSSGKTMHYDSLRASVIMSVSASVIATASSMSLPVSTTYVAFAAVVATGMADRIFQRGDADLKLGRAIWVVTSWFISAMIAAVAAGLVATVVNRLEVLGIAVCLTANLVIRWFLKKRADEQERRIEEVTFERTHPEAFALEEEGI